MALLMHQTLMWVLEHLASELRGIQRKIDESN